MSDINIVLEVKNLVKTYANGVQAVKGINLQIKEGICFGLLGPNGAGKSTTIEMIEGVIPPTSGEIFYRGQPVNQSFKERAGIQFQETALQDFLKVREVLELFSKLYENPIPVEELISLCSLKEFEQQDSHKLSGGQRQRLLLALALVNNPDVIFLDEPTTGLDPQARRNFWNLIQEIKTRKKTIILTTHYMEEAYTLCDEIAIVDKGVLLTQGTPDELLKKQFDTVAIDIPEADIFLKAAEIQKQETLHFAQGYGTIHSKDVNLTIKNLLEFNINLSKMRVRNRTLEDLFIELTGKELRE